MSANTVARKLRLTDGYGFTLLGVITTVLLSFVTLILAVGLAVTLGGRAYGRTTCANWSVETGIETKFAVLNWADSGTCLAKTPDGRWVLNSKWTAFVNAGK